MPKIFKENKLALLIANIFSIFIWILLTSIAGNLFNNNNAPFYIYKIIDLIKFIPPLYLTYYLWIVKKGFQ